MTRRAIAPLLLLLAVLLASFWALAFSGYAHLGGPGGSRLGAPGFAATLAGFFVTALSCAAWPGRRQAILLVASAILLPALNGIITALIVVSVWALFHFVVTWDLPWPLKGPLLSLPFLAPGVIAWMAPASSALGPAILVLTTANFTYRGILYAYEATAKRRLLGDGGIREFFLSLTAFPLVAVLSPPVGFVAQHGNLGKSVDAGLMSKGISQMALGFLYLTAFHSGRGLGVLPSHAVILESVDSFDALTLTGASFLVVLGLFLDLIGHVHVSIGMMRTLGFDIASGSGRPLLSPSLAEYWRRWNTYYRDWLVTIAYYPIAFALKKRARLAVLTAGVATFLLSGFMHFYAEFAANPGPITWRRFLEPQVNLLVIGALVIASLIIETRLKPGGKAAAARKPSPGRRAVSIVVTVLAISLLYTFFRRPFSGAMKELLLALLRPPW